jgi:hypothetical protein
MISARAFTGFLVELESLISVCAATVGSSLFAEVTGFPTAACPSASPAAMRVDRRLADFETSLALSFPSRSAGLALTRAMDMARLGTQLRANLPSARLTTDGESDASHSSVLIGDYLFAAAVLQLEPLGPEVLSGFADFLAAEAENSERTGAFDDERGELAALLTRIAGLATGQHGHSTGAAESRNRALGRLYYRWDRTNTSLARMLFPWRQQNRSAAPVAGAAPLAPVSGGALLAPIPRQVL